MFIYVEVKEVGNLEPGTHITVERSLERLHPSLKVLYPFVRDTENYYHHGVLLENSQVIHLTGETVEDAKPRIADISQFRQGGSKEKLYMAFYDHQTSVDDVEVTLRKAEKVLKDPCKFPKFDILHNNCESFATWLKTGKAHTAQGTYAKQKLSDICSSIGAVAGFFIGKKFDAASTGAVVGSAAGSALSPMCSTLLSSGIGDKVAEVINVATDCGSSDS